MNVLDYGFFFQYFDSILSIFFLDKIFSGAAEPWQLLFQDPATPVMEGIIFFHNDLMVFVVAICFFVVWLLFRCIFLFFNKDKFSIVNTFSEILNTKKISVTGFLRLRDTQLFSHGVNHNTFIEIIWTIIPALIVMVIAVPSFALLYSMEEFIEPSLTVKCTGHQWFWCYEYSNFKKLEFNSQIEKFKFESYMLPTKDLDKGNLRLLEVDQRLLLPINTHIQIIVTASDVLHCWAIPAFGIKIDACPGRLNQSSIFLKREGLFFGQCSEICGINHGFMPIVVRGISIYDFVSKFYLKGLFDELDLDSGIGFYKI